MNPIVVIVVIVVITFFFVIFVVVVVSIFIAAIRVAPPTLRLGHGPRAHGPEVVFAHRDSDSGREVELEEEEAVVEEGAGGAEAANLKEPLATPSSFLLLLLPFFFQLFIFIVIVILIAIAIAIHVLIARGFDLGKGSCPATHCLFR